MNRTLNVWASALGCALLVCGGCVKVPKEAQSMQLQSAESLLRLDDAPGATASSDAAFDSLKAAAVEVSGPTGNDAPPGASAATFTPKIRTLAVTRKLIASSLEATDTDAPGSTVPKKKEDFDTQDVVQILTEVLPNVGVGLDGLQAVPLTAAAADAPGARAVTTPRVLKRFQQYFVAYARGEFVNRQGVGLAAPKVSKAGVGNETITGLEALYLEAFFDEIAPVPVWKNGEKWLTPGGKQPTVSIFDAADSNRRQFVVDVTAGGTQPVSEIEARAIMFIAQVAGEQSRLVSGMAFRLFGDVQVSFVIGGSFAVGDNETLAAATDTFFEVGSRRLAEARGYKFFAGRDSNDESLSGLLEAIKQAYDLLEKASNENKA